MVITRIGPVSVARIAGVVYAALGLLIGAFVSLVAFGGAMLSPEEAGAFGALFGAAAIVVMPIFYGVIGFVGTLIAALLFNAAAGMTGGVEIDVQ